MASENKILIGISSCLVGQRVRYDAGHKLDNYIVGTLGRWFELVPVCPEVAIGLGVPRPPIRLEGNPAEPRVVAVDDRSRDYTAPLHAFGRETAHRLGPVSGYIFKSRSPSCGLWRVKVYQSGGAPAKHGRGAFAQALTAELPLLPVEEEGRLGDPVLRENFIERVCTFHRWQALAAAGITPAALLAFHSAHRLAVMSHGPAHYRTLGRLAADAGKGDINVEAGAYLRALMAALARPATPSRHTRVLRRLAACLRRVLDGGDRTELAETIAAYGNGVVPLAVPLTLLRHHFRSHPHRYAARQVYLEPHPAEWMLRSGS